jgi:hypothetical protein
VTVTERLTLLPAPLQSSVKVLVTVSGLDVSLPEVALVPDQAPEAVQDVAFDEVQLSIVDAVALTVLGAALSDSAGAVLVPVVVPEPPVSPPATVIVAKPLASPPAPVQVRE